MSCHDSLSYQIILQYTMGSIFLVTCLFILVYQCYLGARGYATYLTVHLCNMSSPMGRWTGLTFSFHYVLGGRLIDDTVDYV